MDAFNPITPTQYIPGAASSWQDIDVSAQVPIGATGAILHIVNVHFGELALGLRKKGSTDNRINGITNNTHCWAMIGVDANRVFEAYVGNTSQVQIYLVGYTGPQVVFFTNGVEKNVTSAFVTIDSSAEVPAGAIGLIFEWAQNMTGMRNFGSTDDRRSAATVGHSCFGWIVGCDADRRCQAARGGAGPWLFLLGYVKSGAVFYVNAPNITPAGAGWTDISVPVTAAMVFVEVFSSATFGAYGLRKRGSSEDIQRNHRFHPQGYIEPDASHFIQGLRYVGPPATTMFLQGYGLKGEGGVAEMVSRVMVQNQFS